LYISTARTCNQPSNTGLIAMTDLIERLEKATGPDRHLNALIYLDVVEPSLRASWRAPNGVGPEGYYARIGPRYTESIDAALTLVPSSAQWSLEADTAWVRWMGKDDVEEAQGGFNGREGTCTALALCIAAIKARAAISNQRQSGRMSGDSR
jgi:hypothetical protein